MKKLLINASRSYFVTIGEDLSLISGAEKLVKGEKIALITDDNVSFLYGGTLDRFFPNKKIFDYTIKAGENSKSPENYLAILDFLAENGFCRDDAVLAFGGGVVGDLAAFCASTYMRGITLISVPTTILAAVDSSVGGKTAINLSVGKNLCGTFYQPHGVFICTKFFSTLSEREIACGLGEIIKYSFLSDVLDLESVKNGVTENVVYKCVEIKARIVERDERESGERKLLNLGHTVGHAIEKKSGFSISHGECVVKGLYAILKVSQKFYGFDRNTFERGKKRIETFSHDPDYPFSADELIDIIRSDKKGTAEYIDVVLLDKDLSPKIERLSFEKLRELLK